MPLFQFWERFSSRSTMGSSKITRWIRSSYVGSLLQVLRLYPQERPAGWRTGGSFLLLASSQQSRLSLLMTPWSPTISTGAWWQCTWRGSGDLWRSSQGSLRISSWCYYNSSEDCSLKKGISKGIGARRRITKFECRRVSFTLTRRSKILATKFECRGIATSILERLLF